MSNFDKEKILQYSRYPKSIAASFLGISLEELSSLCRKYGISRWPYHSRKAKEIDQFQTTFQEFQMEKTIYNSKILKINEQIRIEKKIKKEPKGELSYILNNGTTM